MSPGVGLLVCMPHFSDESTYFLTTLQRHLFTQHAAKASQTDSSNVPADLQLAVRESRTLACTKLHAAGSGAPDILLCMCGPACISTQCAGFMARWLHTGKRSMI